MKEKKIALVTGGTFGMGLSIIKALIIRVLSRFFSLFMGRYSENGIYVSSPQELIGTSGQPHVNKQPFPLRFKRQYKQMLWLQTNELLQKIKIEH